MSKSIHQLFIRIKAPEPSAGLESRILQNIALFEQKKLRRKLALTHFGLVSSMSLFALAVYEYGAAFWHSDFWVLMKLLFSDLNIVAAHWSDFAYSLLETFPVLEMIIILTPIFIMLACLSQYFKMINRNHYKFI